MRFRIEHESPGRIRLRAMVPDMSPREADLLDAYLRGLPNVRAVTVHERTLGVTITYRGARAALLDALATFSYGRMSEKEAGISHNSRAISREYKEKITAHVLWYAIKHLWIPAPIRHAGTLLRAIPYAGRALKSLLQGHLDVELLDGAAITASILTGDFDTAGSVMFLLRLGDFLEEWTHKKSVDDLARSMSLQVDEVWRLEGGTPQRVPLEDIREEDEILVNTGHVIPLDGILTQGDVMLNQASLTGESVPVAKGPGASVYAGSVVEEGNCTLQVLKTIGSSKYDRIVRMIEESEKLKSGVEQRSANLADRLVPWCLLTSGLTGLLTGDVTRAVSVLMVDFSCALKLTMPLSVLSAMREAGSHRITVKGGRFLELVSLANTVIFDKTGTLTRACPTVMEVIPFGGRDKDEMLRIAACMEEHFPHSMANAVVAAARERGLEHDEMHSEVEYIVAHGIATHIDGERAIIGSWHFVFEDEGILIPPEDLERFETLDPRWSYLYLALGGVLAAAICISDPLRPEAGVVLSRLRQEGVEKTVMLTGDSFRTAEAVARELGVDEFHAEVLPEDKAGFIQKEHEAGRTVLMVGDGINDAPALSLADVGVAIGDGAVIAREVADITIAAEDLEELVLLRRLSQRLMARIHGNYRFIMTFNGALMLLGALGVLSPSVAALLHNGSTVMKSLSSMTDLLPEETR